MQIGNFYFNGGAYDLDIAEKGFKKALEIDSKILWGHYQMARVYFVKGERARALDEINKEFEAVPQNFRAYYVRALIHAYDKNFSESEMDFRSFLVWAPKEWAGYNDLAWVLAEQKKYKKAKEVLETAFREVQQANQNPWLWNSLGVTQLNLKEYGSAVTSFNRAQKYASKLTLMEWARAYPGNNPNELESGLAVFRAAINENLERAVDNSSGI
ncbi:hypothetical protein HYT00_00325 [Candidatus Giovannonibacteria bacterium]|nr:hypothetical protein [Candidatus Giovannonibacteria bacterium]